jgi:Na+/melibiose symporter-like transporter
MRKTNLTTWRSIALALPALPMAALTIPLVTYLPEFYANTLGLHLSAVGLTFMMARLLDISFDPVFGVLMDRTRTRWGRFKPWLVAGTPLVVVGTHYLMFPPGAVGAGYLLVSLLLTYIGYSMVSVSQLALSAAQTTAYQERSRVFGWWQAAFTLGILIVAAMPMFLGAEARNDRVRIIHAMGTLILVATPLAVLWTSLAVRDASSPQDSERATFSEYLGLFKLRATRLLMGAELVLGFATGLASALGVIFFVSVKRISLADVGLQMLILFTVAIVAAPLWVRAAQRFGKHRAYALGGALNILFFTSLPLLPQGQPLWIQVVSIFAGLAYAATNQLSRAMAADVNDEEILERGVDRLGLFYALLIGLNKVGMAVAVGVAFLILELFGYVPARGSSNPASALNCVTIMYCGATSLLTLCAVLLIARYPLTPERHAQIRKELERRRGEGRSTAQTRLVTECPST